MRLPSWIAIQLDCNSGHLREKGGRASPHEDDLDCIAMQGMFQNEAYFVASALHSDLSAIRSTAITPARIRYILVSSPVSSSLCPSTSTHKQNPPFSLFFAL
jgi:hypothetical protein